MTNLRAFVMNTKVQGESFSDEVDGKASRDTLVFTCDGQKFVMKTMSEQLAEILVENVTAAQKDSTLESIERICWLLAFATQSQVACYGHHYPDGSGPSLLTSINRAGQNTDPVIEPADGAAIREFVDQTYPAFKTLENARSLRVAIDYMLQAARPGLPMECKLVFMFVLLENMKQTYAMQQQYVFKGGKFKDPVTKAQIGFKDMMILMFGAVGMAPNLQALVDLRNEVIHTGVASLTHAQQKLQYDAANDLIREYLLRLLGFKGTFFVSPTGGTVKTI
ncbi:hypothetical protein KYG_00862 [Acidovorax sp. NO-1]|uniref:hypothetical protein n=1 Tax=Acidovorax sp. NO-1 TaxID=512030 RepID=UPI00023FCD78|nr:hypothetical protein [Acidovorax sp. NO-1]EHL24820.1 hypothetical protein KYG_00862 [Acidovorax sp. NO-1]